MPLIGIITPPVAQGEADEQQTLALLQTINKQSGDSSALFQLTSSNQSPSLRLSDAAPLPDLTLLPPVKPSHQVKARRKTTPAIALAPTRTLDPTGQCSSIAAERDVLKKALAFSKKINRELQQATESRHAMPPHAIESQLLAKNSEIAALKKALLAVKAQQKAQIDELTLALENSRNKIDSLQSRLAAGTHSTDKNGEAARATSAQESKIPKLLAALALSQHKLHQQERLLASRSTSKPDEREKTAALVGKIAMLTANASQKEKELSQTRQALAASQTNVDKLRQQLVAITQKFNAMRQSDTRALE